jgi:hypothetical protein
MATTLTGKVGTRQIGDNCIQVEEYGTDGELQRAIVLTAKQARDLRDQLVGLPLDACPHCGQQTRDLFNSHYHN